MWPVARIKNDFRHYLARHSHFLDHWYVCIAVPSRTTLFLFTTWLGVVTFFIICKYVFMIGIYVIQYIACRHHTTTVHYLAWYSHVVPYWYLCNVIYYVYAPRFLYALHGSADLLSLTFSSVSTQYSACMYHLCSTVFPIGMYGIHTLRGNIMS